MRFVTLRSSGAPASSEGKVPLADAKFFPVTGALSTVLIKRVRFVTWLDGEDIQGWPAVQYSNDGVNWSAFPIGVPNRWVPSPVSNYSSARWYDPSVGDGYWVPFGWLKPSVAPAPDAPLVDRTVATEWWTCPSDFQDILQTTDGAPEFLDEDRLFCRFGWLAVNDSQDSGDPTPPRGGLGAIVVESDPIQGGTVVGLSAYCPSGGGNGTTATAVFSPLTRAIPTADVASVRLTLETEAVDQVTVTLGYQKSDDGHNWGTTHTIGSSPSSSANDIVYPTTWLSLAVDDARFIRVGAWVINANETDETLRGALVACVVDWRDE